MGRNKNHQQGETLDVANFTSEGAAGIVSAYREGRSTQENAAAHSQLSSEIRKMNYGQKIIEGKWQVSDHNEPVVEKAILLVGNGSDSGNMKGLLKKLMAENHQAAVVYKAAGRSDINLLFADGSQQSVSILELQSFSKVYGQMRGKPEVEFCLESTSSPKNWLGKLAEKNAQPV
ncbi:hypothetical protein [Endozoicomonas sp. ALB032]|uniref:hypothetical protein n=1 Tax=Endozoicomonas sp. ALB032 TaxID=3403082 RepID=UPI003BB7AC75